MNADRSSEQAADAFDGRARARRHVWGLRPRMLAALLLTSAVTLSVAALALLSPLEHSLRTNGEAGVFRTIADSRAEFAEIGVDRATGRPDAHELAATVALLRRRSGAQVTVLDRHLDTIYSPTNQDLDVPDYYSQVNRALSTGRGVHTLLGDELIAAEPMRIGQNGPIYAVVLVRRLQYVSSAVNVVRDAFIKAAAAGFGIALLLGIALTTTLLRRLERLREAARGLERHGLDAPIHLDERGDEIGDLTRAFASMQARLRLQVRARHAFVANASHELRTPLASLDGTLELLEDDLDSRRLDLADARERTARAREQSRRLSSLASDLLDLSRLDAEVRLRAEPVELGELCRAVAAEFERRAAKCNVQIDVRWPERACWANADPGAVARIVRILLDNAIGVAPNGSHVQTRVCTDGAWAKVSVSDSGLGVPEPERERIFERFQRGSAAEGRSGGFGLGLAIGRELATRMGGTLSLLESARGSDARSSDTHSPDARDPGTHSPDTRDYDTRGACFELRLAVAQLGDDDLR